MSIAGFIARKKQAMRAQKDKLFGSSEEKIKYLEREKEYYAAKEKEQALNEEIKAKKYAKINKLGSSVKKNLQEFKKSRAEYVNSPDYKSNVWRNQSSGNTVFGNSSAPQVKKSKKRRKVIVEYE